MSQPIRIRGYHTDSYGHVNNARYLEFLEDARWALFERHHLMPQLQNIQLVVSRMDIRYRRSATEGDELLSESRFSNVQSRQIQLSERLYFNNSGKTVVEAEVTLIPVIDNKVSRLTPEFYQLLKTLSESVL